VLTRGAVHDATAAVLDLLAQVALTAALIGLSFAFLAGVACVLTLAAASWLWVVRESLTLAGWL